ncbi:ead/Ea22-like family protein [Escherichia coli]|uniref:ead/Ea22-like family protein n=2 Tax=Escherichia coli TaxID=562 RepID=UPI003855D32B
MAIMFCLMTWLSCLSLIHSKAQQRRQPVSKIDYQSLREAVQNYQSTLAWYQEKPDSPNAERDCDAALAAFKREIHHREVDIIAGLLDELDEKQQYIKLRDQENEDIALTVGKLRVELEAEKQRAKVLFMENARLKSGIAGLIHLGIRYADVEVMKIAGDAQLSTPCTDSIINSIATGIRIKGE